MVLNHDIAKLSLCVTNAFYVYLNFKHRSTKHDQSSTEISYGEPGKFYLLES